MNMEELLQKYGLSMDDVNFEIGNLSEEELEQRFAEIKEAMQAAKFDGDQEPDGSDDDDKDGNDDGDDEPESDPEPEQDDNDDLPGGKKQGYQLTGEQMHNGILDALYVITYADEWGTWPRYCYTDYDPVACEVYAYDNEDWNLYGFKYSMNGDNVVIDFESKTRKKIAFVDFDNGDMQFSYKHLLDSANARFDAVAGEVTALREYKHGVESEARKAQENEVFDRFTDLAEDERFINLKDNCADLTIDEIEDKCFAIRGRNAQVKFSQNTAPIRLPVEGDHKAVDNDEPYNGLFVEYGFGD